MNEGEDSSNEEKSERLLRSSSVSRAYVIETSSVQTVRPETRLSRRSDDITVKTVQRDDTKAPMNSVKPDVMYSRSPNQFGVIQALRTGEVASESGNTRMNAFPKQDAQNNDRWNKQDDGKKDQYVAERPKPDTYSSKAEVHSKSEIYKPNSIVQPKSILKRETSKHEIKRDEPKESPLLKENSLMQRLLQESQGQGGSSERSTAAAIEEEINQRTGKTIITVKPSFDVPKTVEQHRRFVIFFF